MPPRMQEFATDAVSRESSCKRGFSRKCPGVGDFGEAKSPSITALVSNPISGSVAKIA